jgi:hypothetical protein
MSSYCKAYLLGQFREFSDWQPSAENARPDDQADSDTDSAAPRELRDDSILYLHDNFIVTDGIYPEEHVIFDNVTPEWRRFCTERLAFRIPEDLHVAAT